MIMSSKMKNNVQKMRQEKNYYRQLYNSVPNKQDQPSISRQQNRIGRSVDEPENFPAFSSRFLSSQSVGKFKRICQNYPKETTFVAREKDFIQMPEGEYSKSCEFRLSCGHLCSLLCRPYDKMHMNVDCQNPCNKICKEGHKCQKKCSEDCGSCEHFIEKTLPSCKHTIKIPCGEQHMATLCSADCNEILNCGHRCPNKCGATCISVCKKIVNVQSPICGHFVAVQCCYKYDSEELIRSCMNPCNAILKCGHKCSGNCNLCRQGRLHVNCMQPCKRMLVCGHECKSNCAEGCPPCKLPCENRCFHKICSLECGMLCDLCTEKCEWNCPHARCSRTCGDMCDRDPCNEPCLKLLQCGHPCIGFCGEPCPKLCRVCDSEEVGEILFGTETESDARFVQLEDCHHILEINGLNEWMKSEMDNRIQMKVCPKCKSAVRTTLRYGNAVKSCLKKIEKVKEVTFGIFSEFKLIQMVNQLIDSFQVYSDSEVLRKPTWRGSRPAETLRNLVFYKLHINKQELYTIMKVLQCLLNLADVETYDVVIPALRSYKRASELWLGDFLDAEIVTATTQQLQQIMDETRRLDLSCDFSHYMKTQTISMPNPDYEKCISILTTYSHFTQDKEDLYFEAFKNLAANCRTAILDITEEERRSILTAMDLPSGHWFQCPNGHVYCITECGGAMEESRCNECNAVIGGTNHELLEDNMVAFDMDGALHAAWSNEANLENEFEEN